MDSAVPCFMGVKSVLGLWCSQALWALLPLPLFLEPKALSHHEAVGESSLLQMFIHFSSSTVRMLPSMLVLYACPESWDPCAGVQPPWDRGR